MNSILTIHLMDTMGIRSCDEVQYPTRSGVPGAHDALVRWQKEHPSLTVLGTSGWPDSLLPRLPHQKRLKFAA